jgi:hypothetical protein
VTPTLALDIPIPCGFNTHLRKGIYAYVIQPVPIYNIPRFQPSPKPKSVANDPFIKSRLNIGDRVYLEAKSDSPQCFHNTYFWYIKTENGISGWVYESYKKHEDDKISIKPGYYLWPTPP